MEQRGTRFLKERETWNNKTLLSYSYKEILLHSKNLAFAYSLTQSCKLCNVNPYDYWENILTNACNPSRTLDNFMSHLWRKQP